MRTVRQVLNDFEKLGYYAIFKNDYVIKLKKFDCVIKIDRFKKLYSFYKPSAKKLVLTIEFEYLKLLHELLEVWE